ncbi:DoxX family protein [Pseudosulfitobacter koreensis]|uniref:DoxX family membrane protein n=1 Tax=Pseudosulfitobacter koreensis TaxID=2968472 RepID=A0ABT1Z311_9RHOB|nr:DoxX family membrane protein [Pseudosulfitobacter koreense]
MTGYRLWSLRLGRALLGAFFAAGAVQKLVNPVPAMDLLRGAGLPALLVWPAMAFCTAGAFALWFGRRVSLMALVLAAYCVVTSAFHFIPDDPWQISIFVKNWAIAGGLLVLASHPDAD